MYYLLKMDTPGMIGGLFILGAGTDWALGRHTFSSGTLRMVTGMRGTVTAISVRQRKWLENLLPRKNTCNWIGASLWCSGRLVHRPPPSSSGFQPVTRRQASGFQYVRTSWKQGAVPDIV